VEVVVVEKMGCQSSSTYNGAVVSGGDEDGTDSQHPSNESERNKHAPQIRSMNPDSAEQTTAIANPPATSETNYWHDLNSTFGSWKTIQVSKLVNRQFSGNMHTVPSRKKKH
jgi:hypothetical protein